ncbi:hypothetical protein BJ875DRAFT_547803 [Amylocarpus encephaloides]|uniref:Uncharacterized protein n=1 Tax=Amylocarpus encephaloides TaxID=45428 RepID=A0A9P7Y6T9_9HELO|nr:hypothetical protein BJ875DRAFT_547803 [Amylocarpus encephaloides]
MDQADSQRGSPPILFDQPSHGSQDDSSHLPQSNKISSQINTDILGHTLSEQSANAVAFSQGSYPVNNQHSSITDHGNAFLGFFDVVQQTSGLAPARPRPSHLEDFLNYTLSEQSAHTTAYSQCSYPASDPQTTLTDLDNTVQPSSTYPNYLGNFPNYILEQSASVAANSQCSYPASDPQTTLTGFDNTVQPSSAYSNYLGNFPNHTLKQSTSVAANSQCSYPASDPQTTLTGFDNTFQPSPSFDSTRRGNLPSHTLFAELNDATAYSQILYPANNPQATLADLGNVHQTSPRS